MLVTKNEKINAGYKPELSEDAVVINAGSFVIDNQWVSFYGTVFKINTYISSVVVGNRTRFFKDRGYAVYLLVCLNPNNGIVIFEGKHVLFTTLQAVPPPTSYTAIPLIGVILIQDGTRDINYGYKPLKQENIIFYNGMGNVLNKNLKGVKGENSTIIGETGLVGVTGLLGQDGVQGDYGTTGAEGLSLYVPPGAEGPRGMTGINWDIYVPFEVLI
jgi:hypothetical protein